MVFEKCFTIEMLFFIAISFPNDFPPIVNAAIIDVVIRLIINRFILNFDDIVVDIITPADPDMIPHMSPITSLQNDDTLALFWSRFIAVLAYEIFFEFIEWNGFMSHVVIATPTMSNIIPISINIINIIVLAIMFTFGIIISDDSENMNDIMNAIIIILIVHKFSFFIFYFLSKKNGY